MPVTAEMAERWGLVNHVVDDNEVLSKAIKVAEAIARNNRNLVVLYKSVINDGFKLDLEHAQALEKVRACTFSGTFYLHVNVFLIKLSILAEKGGPGASGRVLPLVTGWSRVRVAVSSHCTGEGKACH